MGRNETVGYKIRLIHNQIQKRIEERKRRNGDELTGMQRWILGFLMEHENEEIYQREIEAEFSVSRATASNMLQVMERRELILRIPASHDARLKRLALTDRARKMVTQARQDVREMEALLKKGFSQEEERQFLEYLGRVIGNLEEAVREEAEKI